jgi:hypothetical protein
MIRLISVLYFFSLFTVSLVAGNRANENYLGRLISTLQPNATGVSQLEGYREFPKCMHPWIDDKRGRAIIRYIDDYFKPVKSLILNEKGECKPDHTVVLTGAGNIMHDYFGHFPHFALLYLRVYSTLLWQTRAFHHKTPCVYKLSVNETSSVFWSTIASNQTNLWVKDALMTVHNLFNINTITSDVYRITHHHTELLMPWMKVIFLHPADSLLLTSTLLQTDPCQYHNRSTQLINQKLNIVILSRKGYDRLLLNTKDVYTFLNQSQGRLNLTINSLNITSFEGLSIYEQASMMSKVDVFIGIHGAAFTNTAFMKPCSIMIEVFPWLFNSFAFYRPWHRGVNLIHHSWMEKYENTTRFKDENEPAYCPAVVRHYYNVQKMYSKVDPRFYDQLHNNMSYFYNPASFSTRCMKDPRCEKCTRTVKGLSISLDTLKDRLEKALEERKQCILENEFYHPSNHSFIRVDAPSHSLHSKNSHNQKHPHQQQKQQRGKHTQNKHRSQQTEAEDEIVIE